MNGQLTIGQVSAQLAHDPNLILSADPYVIYTIGNEQQKTHVCHGGGHHPHWSNPHTFNVQGADQMLIRIYDKDILTFDDFMAEGVLNLNQVAQQRSANIAVNLQKNGTNGGVINLQLTFQPGNY